MITALFDITELFMRMFQGDWIAWAFFSAVIALIAIVIGDVVWWWKTPQPAKKMTLNNIFGKNATVADCYDDQYVRFETPSAFRHGILYDKGSGFHFIPGFTSEQADNLSLDEQALIKKVYSVSHLGTPFYFASSSKGTLMNPKLLEFLEHEKLRQKVTGNSTPLMVPKETLITVLQTMKDKMIQIEPMWVSLIDDPRKINEYLAQSTTQVQLMAHEEKIKRDALNYGGGGKLIIVEILVVITIFIGILNLLKGFGVF